MGAAAQDATTPARARRIWLFAFLTIASLTLTWFVGIGADRYRRVGPNLVDEAAVFHGAPAQQVRIDEPIEIVVSEPKPITWCMAEVPVVPGERYELCGQMTVREVAGVSGFVRGGRLLLIPVGDDGEPRYHEKHHAVSLTGSEPWREAKGVFEIPAGCSRARVGVDLHATNGLLRAHSIELWHLELQGRAEVAYWLLVTLWLFTMVRGLSLLLPNLRLDAPHVAAFVLLVGLFVGVLVPKQVPRAVVHWARDVVRQFDELVQADEPDVQFFAPSPIGEVKPQPSPEPDPPSPERRSVDAIQILQKLWHVVLFFAVAWALLATRAHRARGVIAAAAALAVATELLQMFTATRSAAVFDVGCDLTGALLAVLVFGTIQRVRRPRRR